MREDPCINAARPLDAFNSGRIDIVVTAIVRWCWLRSVRNQVSIL